MPDPSSTLDRFDLELEVGRPVEVDVTAQVQRPAPVRNATGGGPVPEVLATLIAADGQVIGSDMTDTEGRFRFEDLATGLR